MMFLKVKNTHGRVVLINVRNISSIEQVEENTIITMINSSDFITIKTPIEEFIKAINSNFSNIAISLL